MKKTKLLLMTVFLTSGISQAEYSVHIPLDHNITIKDFEVVGAIHLTPTVINRGGSSSIRWNYSFGNEINIEGLGTYKDKSGQVLVSPTVSTEYSIVVKNGSKSKTEKLSLTVIQPTQQINFTADKYRIGYGNSATLSWDVSDATSVDIDNGVGSGLNESGASHVSPKNTTLYTLTAKGYEGISDSKKTVNIIVVPDSIINSFTVNNDKLTTGENAIFSWQVANAESLSLNPFGPLTSLETGSQMVPFATAGNFTYTLESVSLSGKKDAKTKNISVFDPALISSFTVNGKRTVNIAPNTALNFAWATTSAPTITLNNTAVTGSSSSLTSANTAGNTNYILKATNGANKSVSDTVVVTVIDNPAISGITAPSNVFANEPFNMSWSGSSITNYKLKSNNGSSGIPTSDKDYGTANSTNITTTAVGNYTYTLTATNEAEATTTSTKTVIAEADPTFTNFTVNGGTNITVSPNTSLSFLGVGLSDGAFLSARNSDGSLGVNAPTASSTAGTTVYYGAAAKTVNFATRTSPLRNVSVTVVNAPSIGTITAPSVININTAFNLSWTGTDAISYNVNGSTAASGLATSPVSNGGSTSRSITPTAAGSYTYTVTGINAAGVSTSKTSGMVKVENWVATSPTYTDWVNSGAVYNCSVWTPDASTVNAGTNFTQTRSCSQNQTRNKQDRQTETGTGDIRNIGVAVAENQTVTVGGSQTAAGTKAVAECQYSYGKGHQEYVWATGSDDYGDYTFVTWNNVQVFNSDTTQFTSATVPPYYYYMGPVMVPGRTAASQVCRKLL